MTGVLIKREKGHTERRMPAKRRPRHMGGRGNANRGQSVAAASLGMPRTANKALGDRMTQKILPHAFQREPGLARALTADFQPPELWDSFCCFNLPSWRHFVLVALGNSYTHHPPPKTTNWFTSTKEKTREHIMNDFVYIYLQGCLKKNSYPQKWSWLEKALALQSSHLELKANFRKCSGIHSSHQRSVLQLYFLQMDLAVNMTRFLLLSLPLVPSSILGGLHSLLKAKSHECYSHWILTWLGVLLPHSNDNVNVTFGWLFLSWETWLHCSLAASAAMVKTETKGIISPRTTGFAPGRPVLLELQ